MNMKSVIGKIQELTGTIDRPQQQVTTFNDRMSMLIRRYEWDTVARELGVDTIELGRWSNSGVMTEAPRRIDYTYFKYKHPEISPEWLETGIGPMLIGETGNGNGNE